MVLHGLIKGGCRLACKTEDGIAVRAVVRNFKIHDGVVVADDLVDVVAGLAVLLQNPDAVLNGIGEVVEGQTQLFQGAQHAVRRLAAQLTLGDVHAAGEPGVVQRGRDEIALVDVLRAGDDLYGFLLAHVHLTHPHMVGVGVADDGEHLANDHVFDLGVHALVGFHLLTGDGHGFDEILIGNIGEVNKFLVEPFSV